MENSTVPAATEDAEDGNSSDAKSNAAIDDIDMMDLAEDASLARNGSPKPPAAELPSRPKHAPAVSDDEIASTPEELMVDDQMVVDKLVGVVEQACNDLAAERKGIRVTSVQAWIYRYCRIVASTYKQSKSILPHYSAGVLQKLNSKWDETPLWDELETLAGDPPPLLLPPFQILPQLDRRSARITPTTRPGQAQAAVKQWPKKPLSTPPSRTAGKMASLRPSTGKQLKRSRDEMERGSGDSTNPDASGTEEGEGDSNSDGDKPDGSKSFLAWRRRRIERAVGDEELQRQLERDASPFDEGLSRVRHYRIDDMPLQRPLQAVPGVGGKHDETPARRLVIRNLPQVDTTPMGPGGAWQCEEDGCHHVVYRADNGEGQERVREHIRTHEESAARIKLALLEGGRGNASIEYVIHHPALVSFFFLSFSWPSCLGTLKHCKLTCLPI